MTFILAKTKHTVTRADAEGDWVNGHYVSPSSSTLIVKGSLQPIDGVTITLLPEGARSEAKKMLICDKRQAALKMGDRVAASDGLTYRVMLVQDWTDHKPLPYRSYVLGEVTSV